MQKIFLFIAILSLFGSCSDLLEPEQVNLVYNEVFWKSEEDAEIALLGTYALYRGLMVDGNWYERGDVTTGFFNRGWNGGSNDAFYKPGDYSSSSTTERSWGELESYSDWSDFYKVVAHANLVIKKIEGMSDEQFSETSRDQILGEAYFLRALVYFNIARNWGNAPYISDAIESSEQVINNDLTPVMLARSSDSEILTKVLEDVNKAIDKLDYQALGSADWGIRAGRGAAEALAGHANMWMNFLAGRDNLPNAEQYLTKAIQCLESLTAKGGYSLVSYERADALSYLYEGQSSEAVFELNISTDQNESYRIDYGGVVNITSKVVSLDGDATKDRASSINFIPKSQKSLIYPDYDFDTESGDIRADLFFDAWESPYNEAFSNVSTIATNRNLVTWMMKYSMMTEDASRVWNAYTAYFAEANIPVFRFTDVYLLLAEAYAKTNQDGKAKSIVDEIRSRAGLEPYAGSELLQEVLQQRISELIGEGQVYYDMVRNNYWPNTQVMDQSLYAQQGYYWPVSSDILEYNKLVSQTPYWNGKTSW